MSDFEDTSSLDDFINAPATPAAVETPSAVVETPSEPELPLGDGATTAGDPPADVDAEKARSANRFTAQTRALREAERKAADLEARLAAIENKTPLTNESQSGKAVSSKEPNPAEYQYGELDPKFVSDLADFRADLKITSFREELRQQQETAQQASAAQREAAALRETADKITHEGTSKFSDFDEVVIGGAKRGDFPLDKEMFELAAASTVAADALYHFGKNPAVAEQVAAMPLAQKALWFAEFKMAQTAPKARVASAAPEPIANARGAGSRATVADDTDDLEAFERKFYNPQR